MAGNLGLASPWAREALTDPLRSELRALIPDDWTIGLSVPGAGTYRAWANNDLTGDYALHIVERSTAEAAIRDVIIWISSRYTSA